MNIEDCICEPRKCVISICNMACPNCKDLPQSTIFQDLSELLSQEQQS